MALQPVLIVGVGGSGVKTLMALRSVLLRRLRALPGGWTEDRLPAAWQLLAIDTEWEQPSDFGAPRLPEDSFHSLVPRIGNDEPQYQDLIRPLINRISPEGRPAAIGGWMEKRYDRPPSRGAGQFRAIGRAVAVADLGGVRDAVERARTRLDESSARRELAAIADRIGDQAGSSVLPVLVSSVAGGTGSGMFIDVIEAMRAVDSGLARDAQVMLYGPDVFEKVLKSSQGKNIPANALAAVCEITAGVWADGITEGTRRLYELGRLSAGRLDPDLGENAFGARYHYLIGRYNLDGAPVATDEAAYWAIADALGALVTDPSVLGPFRSYFITNVFSSSSEATVAGDASGLSVENESKYLNPFASIGAGRLAVGSERLLEYAVQALGRSVVERLLWPAYEPSDAASDVEEAAERAWLGFLVGSGLDERDVVGGPVRDEVVEALRLPSELELVAASVRRIIDQAASGTETEGITAAEWTRRLLGAYERELPEVTSALEEIVAGAARDFARGAEERLLRSVSQAVADHGYAVADALLGRLDLELRFVGEEQLPTQAEAERRRLDEIPGGLAMVFEQGVGLGVADARDPVLGVVRDGLEISLVGWIAHPLRCRAAARLLLAIRAELLPSLRESLRSAKSLLEKDVAGDTTVDRAGNPYASFPRLGEPASESVRIGPTEVLLVGPDRYAAELDAAGRATVGEKYADQWQLRFVDRTIRRVPLNTRDDDTRVDDGTGTGMFTVDRAWMPEDPELRWAPGADAVRPRYHGLRSVLEVVDIAEILLRDRNTNVGRLVSRSIREYLTEGGPTEVAERGERFVSGLVEVMSSAAPLATLNRSLAATMHPEAALDARVRIVSTIPVPPGSPLHDRMRQALERAGVWDPRVDAACGESDATHVDVFQSLGVALGPASFTTMTAPAWERWCEVRAGEGTAESFWGRKRARPLIETLPIAGPRLRQLVAGWYSWLPLGLVVHETRGGLGRHVAVHDPDRGATVPGPHPMFERWASGPEVLPALLGSLPLALAEAGVEGSLEPLRPYRLLIGAGRELDRGDGAVRRWILEGALPAGVTPALGDADLGTPAGRRDALLAALGAEREAVTAAVADWDASGSIEDRMWKVPPVVQLADLLLEVLDRVTAAVGAVPVGK